MRLVSLTVLTLLAFAANSVLNRLALAEGGMDVMLLAAVRVGSGALMLALLLIVTGRGFNFAQIKRPAGVAALLLYLFAFSLAHRELPSGVGALLLFGMVQITMFVAAVREGETISTMRWVGTGVAFLGLCWMLWPRSEELADPATFSFVAMLTMLLAGVGWGLYSLFGRHAKDPVQATAMNFILATPVALLVLLLVPADLGAYSTFGITMGVISGAITSGLGYSLWYRILPELGATRAAVTQLSVPVIAAVGGVLFIAEAITLQFVISAVLVLGGIGLAIMRN